MDSHITTLKEMFENPIVINYKLTKTKLDGLNEMFTINAGGEGGIKSSRLYTILGCTGSGKSLFLLNLAYLLSAFDNVLYVSLENTQDQTLERLQNMEIDLNSHLYLNHPTKNPNFASWDFYDTIQVEQDIETLKNQGVDIQVVIIDYLGEIQKPSCSNDYEAYGKVMSELKEIAKKRNIAIMTASQCNREALKIYKQAKTEQDMIAALCDINESHVSDSAKIIHISDFVLYVHRLKSIKLEGFRNGQPGPALFLSVLKNRDYCSKTEKAIIPYKFKYGNDLSNYTVKLN